MTLSHYNEGELDRRVRLTRVLLHVEDKDPSAAKIISGLHDHKGTLFVNWTTLPSTTQLITTVDAWAAEGELSTNHFVKSKPLICDVNADWPGP